MIINDYHHLIAPAKINLYLHITGKTEDEYHTLDSMVDFVDIGDNITIYPADKFTLSITGDNASEMLESCPNQDNNLIIKAANYIKSYIEVNKLSTKHLSGANIKLEKILPISSGIGGGSSDAATIIVLLLKMWEKIDNIKLPHQEILQKIDMGDIAKKLGADVPMCLHRRPLIAKNIGEKIELLEPAFRAMHYLLVNPKCQVSTASVFSKVNLHKMPKQNLIDTNIYEYQVDKFCNSLTKNTRNHLELVAKDNYPIIRICLDALAATKTPLLVRMSGSGATCFAIYSDEKSAINAKKKITEQFPDWWVVTANSLR